MEEPQSQENASGAPEYLNILVANAPLAMAMFDRDMKYLVANQLWLEEFNLQEIPIKGESHYEIFPDLHESWREVYDRCLEGHVERCEEDIFQRPDGSRDWVRWEVRPWRHQTGEIGGLIISCEVVTERKRTEHRVQFEKDFTEGLLAGASPVVVIDLEGRIGRSSQGARELSTGNGIEDGETFFWDAFVDEPERGEVEQSFQSEIERAKENGTFSFPNSTVTIFTDGSGSRRKITWTNTAQKNDSGEVDRIIRIGFSIPVENEVAKGDAEAEDVAAEVVAAEVAEAEETVAEVEPGGEEQPADAAVEEKGDSDEINGAAGEDPKPEAEESELAQPNDEAQVSDTGASLRELAEKVRAARGAAAVRPNSGQARAELLEGTGDEDGDFLVGQPFAPDSESEGEPTDESKAQVPKAESENQNVQEEPEVSAGDDLIVGETAGADNMPTGDLDDDKEVESGSAGSGSIDPGEDADGEEPKAEQVIVELNERIARLESEVQQRRSATAPPPPMPASPMPEPPLVARKVEPEEAAPAEMAVPDNSPEAPEPPLVGRGRLLFPPESSDETTPEPEEETAPEAAAAPLAEEPETEETSTAPPLPEPPTSISDEAEAEPEESPSGNNVHEQAVEHVPFGLILLDEELEVVYSNPRLTEILGFELDDADGVEGWIRKGCPDEMYAEEVITEWRNAVWRRQLTKTFTLSDDTGSLREVEFRPNLLEDGRLLLTVQDVTDSRRSEEALRASESKFRAVFQDSGVGIALVDQTGDIFDVNPAMEHLLGTTRSELRLQGFDECIHSEDVPIVHAAVTEIIDGGKRAAELTARLSKADDGTVWTRLNIVVVRDPDGEPMFTAYFAHDISEQRRATSELEESQEQNRALLEATPDLLFLVDKKGHIEDFICSADFPIKVGDTVIGADLREVVPQLRNTLDGQLEEVADSNSVVKSRFSAGGHKFETRLVRSGEGHRVMILRDQTEALTARDKNPRNPAALELLGDAVVTVDKDGVVTDWNSRAADLFGASRTEALGRQLATFYGAENPDEFWKTLRSAVVKDGTWGIDEFAFTRRDGTTGQCSIRFTALDLDESSKPISMIGVHRDLTMPEKDESEETAVPVGMLAPEVVYKKITNNLQIIYSLLNLQVNTLDDADARATLMASQNRVRAISFVHQQLREHDGIQQVDFAGFVDLLSDHLREAYGIPPEQVSVRIGFSDLYVPLEPSIPLALVLNELMSNSLRHGFAEGSRGELGIDLKLDGGVGNLIVRDTGRGLPEGDYEEIKGLGLHIATTLVQQVGGTLAPTSGPDTAFEVQFKI